MSDTGETGNTTQEWSSFFTEAEKRAASLSSTEGAHVIPTPPRQPGIDTGEVLRREREAFHAKIAEMEKKLRTLGPWVKELTGKLKKAIAEKKRAEDLLEESVLEADELRGFKDEAVRQEDEVRRLRKEIQLLHRTVATHKAVALASQEKVDALTRSGTEASVPASAQVPQTSVPMLASADVLMTEDVVDDEDVLDEPLSPSDEVIELRAQLEGVLNQLDEANRRAEEAMRCEAGALQMIAELERRFDTLNAEVISQRRFNAAKAIEAATVIVSQDEVAVRASIAAQLRKHLEQLAQEIETGGAEPPDPEPVPSAAPPLAEDTTLAEDDWLAASPALEKTGEISGPVPTDWADTLAELQRLAADPVIKVDRTVTLEIDEADLAAARAERNTLIMQPPVPLSRGSSPGRSSGDDTDMPSSEEIALDMGAALEGADEEATRPIADSAEEAAELAAMAEEIRKERSQEVEGAAAAAAATAAARAPDPDLVETVTDMSAAAIQAELAREVEAPTKPVTAKPTAKPASKPARKPAKKPSRKPRRKKK